MIRSAFESAPPLLVIAVGMVIFYLGFQVIGVGLKGATNESWLIAIDRWPMLMFLASIAATLAWQSSSLTTALLVAMVASGRIGLPAAFAGILGANVGTTGTAHLAAWISGGYAGQALAAAKYHTIVNLTMAAIFLNPWALNLATRLLK